MSDSPACIQAGFHILIFYLKVFTPAVIGGTSHLIFSKLRCSASRCVKLADSTYQRANRSTGSAG
jgi:hypothetical protein